MKPKSFDKKLTFSSAPLEEINAAIRFLNAPEPKIKKTHCVQKSGSSRRQNKFQIPHKSLLHFLSLIKNAILKEEWNLVLRLLLKFFDEPRNESMTMTPLIKYTMIFILNDPHARSTGVLSKYLHLIMQCENIADEHKILKKMLTLVNKERK